ncbi:MAG: SMC-Scp complex subunit ScpB [Luteitalea sp.]|nr:SMC-Scp complex subunit ScpB [Luteitalea sp.]
MGDHKLPDGGFADWRDRGMAELQDGQHGQEEQGAQDGQGKRDGREGLEGREGQEVPVDEGEPVRAERQTGHERQAGLADREQAGQDGPDLAAERIGPDAPAGDDGVAAQAEQEARAPDVKDDRLERFPRASAELKAILEALIFASPDPLSPKAICKLLDNEPQEDVLAALVELRRDYERPGGLELVDVAGGLQIVTRSDLHEWVRRLFHERSSQKLSVQALETLAVVAYRQPVTAAEITDIRGVNTSGVLNTLLERHLIKIVGRKRVVGRPFMYATTREFLMRFGLNDLADLPKVEDMAEALGIENPLLVEQATSEELLPLEEPETDAPSAAPEDDLSDQATPDGPTRPS